MRVPRYLPGPVAVAWARALTARSAETTGMAEALASRLVPRGHGLEHWQAWPRLRDGLAWYFTALRGRTTRKKVLVPAQVCAAVHQAVRRGGFEPLAVDVGARGPTPDAEAYLRHVSNDCAAVVVAPLYGHLPGDWRSLAELSHDVAVVFDAAQAAGRPELLQQLAGRADAVGFSLGLGKGADCGGGLLMLREALEPAPNAAHPALLAADAVARAVALRLLAATPLYSRLVERGSETSLSSQPRRWASAPLLAARCYGVWKECLDRFAAEVGLARARARRLEADCGRDVGGPDFFADSQGSHLRQLVQVSTPGECAELRKRLRGRGIDCDFAGEPLPEPAAAFPNADRFRRRTLRLPFLGRLSEPEFEYLSETLKACIDQRLPG